MGEYTTAVDMAYQLKLGRNSLFYKRIFCGPLIGNHQKIDDVFSVSLQLSLLTGAYLCILLSFWCRGFVRAALNLLGTLITALMFIVMADYAPVSYVPKLIVYYEWSLVLSWLAFVAFVTDCCLDKYTYEVKPLDWLSSCMNMTWLRLTLGMDISNVS